MLLKLLQLCFSLVLCTASAFAPAAPFSSPGGYSLTLPAGWRAAPHRIKGEDAAFFLPQPTSAPGAMMPNVNIRILPASRKMTIARMKSFLASQKSGIYSGLRLVSQSDSSLGGVRDVDTVLLDTQHGKPNRLRQIWVLRSGSLYILSMAYPESKHTQYGPAIAQMLASFHWK